MPPASYDIGFVFMGLLAVGTPLTWEEALKYAEHVRYHGITQLLNIWNRYKTRAGDKLYWGDEVRLFGSSILTLRAQLVPDVW